MRKYPSNHPLLSAFGLFVVLLAIFIAVFEWDWLRGPLERMASAKTERTVTLGHLDVKLAWPPVVKLTDVRVGNIQNATPERMITADEIDIAVDIPSLFGPDIVIPEVRLSKPDIHLARFADGRTNWTFGKPGEPSKGTVRVQKLSVDNGVIAYDDRIVDLAIVVQAATGPSPLQDSERHRSLTTQLAFKGSYNKIPFDGTASTADVLSLQESGAQFPLLTKLTIGRTRLSADGVVTDLLKPSAIDAQLSIAGPDLAALYPTLPLVLPSSPPYRIAGRFTQQGETFGYQGFKGVIGKSDIAGDASFTSRAPRPLLKAKLRSQYLGLEDLGPLIGMSPAQRAAKPADTKTIVAAKPVKVADQRVLPQQPFKLDRLNAMDADVTLDVKKLNVPDELPLEDLYAAIKVDAGKLTLTPLKLGVADGDIVAQISLDGSQNPIAVDADISVSHAKLSQLFPTTEIMKQSDGAIGAKVHLVGRGNSVADMLATSRGSAQFAMSGGTVSSLMIEAVGLDGGEILKFLVRGDSQTPIRCAGASFKVNDGQAESQVIVFDTGDTRVDGKGKVDMKNEKFDIVLSPEPKDRSILSFRAPLRLYGSFSQPGYSVLSRELALRVGSAVALGFVNPLLALVPLIETGPGSNTDCEAVFRATAAAVKGGKTKMD
ncbi:AsmA family protein [Uliginosibacterium sp. H3]|uniref:AsmA family protein n=1 Tax=Uliginosibacterium silvisoli TaxID=3114758 RepID=A0ABU6K7K2_9RHOO|nr:AsmA family protein [Uliginosibacterium sp. H3]